MVLSYFCSGDAELLLLFIHFSGVALCNPHDEFTHATAEKPCEKGTALQAQRGARLGEATVPHGARRGPDPGLPALTVRHSTHPPVHFLN